MSKKLAKEREEMCRDLSRLHESMIELHDQMIMEMQVMIMIMIMIMMMIMLPGVLIAGGDETGGKAEFYIPNTGLHCPLPDLPAGQHKARHLQLEQTLCGGYGDTQDFGTECLRQDVCLSV